MALLETSVATPNTPQTADLKHNLVVLETEIELSSDSEADDPVLPGHILSSPYTDATHQLDLSRLAAPVGHFARALMMMRNTRPDYAASPYAESFNWREVVESFSEQSDCEHLYFFVIVFRSRLKQDADRELLGELDKAAHLEAVEAGGLLKYWFGSPDHNRRNLATCLWRARGDARLGGAGPGHAAAMTAARKMYDEWFVERLKLTIDARSVSWKFEQWID